MTQPDALPANPSDAQLHSLLASAGRIAVVGCSDKPYRDSYMVANYLRRAGYKIYAVNPRVRSVFDDPAYPDLRSLPEPVDIVNVFRRSEHLPQIVADAIAIGARAIWAQLGVSHPPAAARARAAGLVVVMDRCIKVDHLRLGIARRA
jgi:predicted CoA-binding protein